MLSLAYEKFDGSTFVDVGCNIGMVSLPIAKRFPDAKVISIDASPKVLGQFVSNMEANGLTNVSIVSGAISSDKALLSLHSCPTNSGGHNVFGFGGRKDVIGSYPILVQPLSLAEVFDHFALSACGLLKIDVEGYETNVLKSVGSYLVPGFVKMVVCEYGNGLYQAGSSGLELLEFMFARGYRCSDLHSQRPIRGVADLPKLGAFEVTDFVFE
jgi:FkbM family methyltransferase